MSTLEGRRCLVTGGSRGLGRGIVEALVAQGGSVAAVGLHAEHVDEVAKRTGAKGIRLDVTDDEKSGMMLRELRPEILVLCAGAMPPLGPLPEQTWEGFSHNWNVDVKSTFFWLRHVLRIPLAGAHVIVISSGAAARGSPVSGGYASAKRAQWFLADYAREEAKRMSLDIRFHCLLPMLNPSTELGRAGIEAYAQRNGVSFDEYAKRFSPPLTPAIMGQGIVSLATEPERWKEPTYQIGGAGLTPLG